MTQSQQLFDRGAIVAHRKRAERLGFCDFLHRAAIDEIHERLLDINRRFTAPAIVTGFPASWGGILPNARLISDDDILDLAGGAHDLVIHAMCLHQANDPVGQIIQCRRALKPDGLFLACLIGGNSLNELRVALGDAEIAVRGGLSPRVAPMAEIRDLGSVLQRAGLALPVADSMKLNVRYGDVSSLFHDLRAMGETNALALREKTTAPRDLFAQTARIYKEQFETADGRIPASFEIIFLTGWAPDASQQQPLKPGSAKTRLADFLNTTELGEDAKPVKADKDHKR